MTTVTTTLHTPRSINDLLRRAWAFSPLLTLAGLANLLLIPAFIVALLADPRVITGVPAWIKPLKFAISIAIFSATFVWLLTFVGEDQRPPEHSKVVFRCLTQEEKLLVVIQANPLNRGALKTGGIGEGVD